MKYVEKKIHVKDRELQTHFERARAARIGMQIMAENVNFHERTAWELATKLYDIDTTKIACSYDEKT
ncbi:hypothetical protein MUP79_09805, partial [Candidatus Bathyarchaeota archaeon]|nr:hypothetical protein [Candidatus Bathyarchaeota archaeon]